MRIPRVYVDAILSSGEQIELPLKQSNYLCKVLRMDVGRELWLFNGCGGAYHATLCLADPKKAKVLLGEADENDRESPLNIELGIALSKGDRFDLVVQKATELGVSRIQPLISERVDIRLNAAKTTKKVDHWRGVSISACEQSGRNIVPEICEPISLQNWCTSNVSEKKILLDPEAESSLTEILTGVVSGAAISSVAVLIGPEGGLCELEIELAKKSHFLAASLGSRILRTETAPLVVLSLVQSRWGDL